MRGLGWTVGAAVALLSPMASAAQSVLPVGTTSQFNSLMDEIRAGAIGPGIKDANIEVRRDHVVVNLRRKGHRDEHIVLTRPNDNSQGTRARYFVVSASPSVPGAEVSSLVGLLDSTFPTDPWVTVPSPGESSTDSSNTAPAPR